MPATDGARPRSRRRWSSRKAKRGLYNLLTIFVLLLFALPAFWIIFTAVSYTHLTLPTSDLV